MAMDMARQKQPLNCYIDPDLWERFDAWIRTQPYGASKTKVVETLLREFLEKQDKAKRS